MIKDIIVNLEHKIARDPARDFAITIAETFDTHVVGIAFGYAPGLPGYAMLEIPPISWPRWSLRARRPPWPR